MLDVILALLPVGFLCIVMLFHVCKQRKYIYKKKYFPVRSKYFLRKYSLKYDEKKDCEFWRENKSYFAIMVAIDIAILIIMIVLRCRYSTAPPFSKIDYGFQEWVVFNCIFLYICGYRPWKACKKIRNKDSSTDSDDSQNLLQKGDGS